MMMNKNRVKVPELRFPEFEGEWIKKDLGRLINCLDAGVSVNSIGRVAKSCEMAILKTSCVFTGIFDISQNKAVVKEKEILRLREPVISNTIIISRMNTPALVGANAFVNESNNNVFLPDRLWAAKIHHNANPFWVSILLSSQKIRLALSNRATGTSNSMKNITKGDVLTLPVNIPTPPEQTKITNFLTSVDKRINLLQKKKAELTQYKKGIMQKLFSQEIRFKQGDGSDFHDWEEKKLGAVADVRDGTHESPKYYHEGFPLVTSKNLMENGKLNFENINYSTFGGVIQYQSPLG